MSLQVTARPPVAGFTMTASRYLFGQGFLECCRVAPPDSYMISNYE